MTNFLKSVYGMKCPECGSETFRQNFLSTKDEDYYLCANSETCRVISIKIPTSESYDIKHGVSIIQIEVVRKVE